MTEKYYKIENGRYAICCKEYLPGGDVKSVILGVHGFAGDKESSALKALAEAASEKNCALICFDFPAHGESGADEEYLTVENCMNDLITVAGHCREKYPEAEKALFATSFGGYIGLLCLGQLSDFKIVLRAPAVTFAEHILLDILNITRDDFRKTGAVNCGYERKLLLPFDFLEDTERHPVTGRNHETPMLIIHGNKDDVVPIGDIENFCEVNPEAVLKIIDGADHRFKNPGEIDTVVKCAMKYTSF